MKIIKATDNHYYVRHWFVWNEYYNPDQVLAISKVSYEKQTLPWLKSSALNGYLTYKQYKFQASFNSMDYRRLNAVGVILLIITSPIIKIINWGVNHGHRKHSKTSS